MAKQFAPHHPDLPPAAYAKTSTLAVHLGVESPFILRMEREGILPKPVKLGTTLLWPVAEVKAAIAKAQQGGQK